MTKTNEYIFNPVTFFGIGLYPILAICTNLQNAARFALIMLIVMVASSLIICALRPIINKNVRIPCYILIVLGIMYFIDSMVGELWVTDYSNISYIFSYVFVSTVIIFMFETSLKNEKFLGSLLTSLNIAIEYVLCMIIVGLVRQILSGVAIVGDSGVSFFQTFIGGLVVLCLYALGYNYLASIIKKRRRVYLGLVDRYTLLMMNKQANAFVEPFEEEVVEEVVEDGVAETLPEDNSIVPNVETNNIEETQMPEVSEKIAEEGGNK
jgi:electron transport complex protein RnfE